jgi:hypothetical protein
MIYRSATHAGLLALTRKEPMIDFFKCPVCDEPLNAADIAKQQCPNPDCGYSWHDEAKK